MKKITENTPITKVIEINPDSIELLFELGLGCIGCSLSAVETIGQGMRGHGFSDKEIKEVIKELNK
ncbi:MAG: DUF1858 domain-containing protein [Nanoarchaeota archaeon]|nr:DUF1858 domain-containing protein [Nanoarchaeota archaeon]